MAFCFSCVEAGHVGAVQRFGDFVGIQEPGCGFILWPISTVTPVSLAVHQLSCQSVCKSKDNVTMSVNTAVQYRVMKDKVKIATFDIVDPQSQMRAEVDNVLRSTLPSMDLDEAYVAKDNIVTDILSSVKAAMDPFGYDILNVLITDLVPERSVLTAMNEINASRRQRVAAQEKGEAEKVLKIKASEADAESKRLAGVGMASMRSEIAQGIKKSISAMQDAGMSADEANHMMVMSQYLDTLKEFATEKSSIMIPHGPGAVKDLQAQIREGFERASSRQGPSNPQFPSPTFSGKHTEQPAPPEQQDMLQKSSASSLFGGLFG
eukprot:TRINITY_DN18834_c0_g1_i1.p1 TRINITY_DN18834_c0_g1~~TRINITY_DN18834_c0_g1_i1.p1  ORF type:complete len:321 (-),score=62.10 TRINITY_DN18834_c0_g1_i1:30-992(-)